MRPRSPLRSCVDRSLASLLLLGALVIPSGSQEPAATLPAGQDFSSYEGQKISSVEIAGRPGLDADQFRSVPFAQPGETFSNERVRAAAAALRDAGSFKDVRVEVHPAPEGVRVVYTVQPAVYIGIFEFPGAGRFNYSRLLQVTSYPVQAPFNAVEVEQDRRSLLNYLEQEGFFEARVETSIQEVHEYAIANVIFHVTLGRRARFGAVSIEGAPESQEPYLLRRLTRWLARLRGAAVRPGSTYRYTNLSRATQYVQGLLRTRGYLGAQVKLGGAEYHPGTNRADIRFEATPGARTTVSIRGARVWSWTRRSTLPVYQGVPVDEESVDEGRDALVSLFQNRGFSDVEVESRLEKGPKGDTVFYQITRNGRHRVSSVRLTGNTSIPDSELTPHIGVKKRRLFTRGNFSELLVRSSVRNIEAVYQSNGFSSVQVSSDVERENRDLHVTFHVNEGPRDIVNSITVEGAHSLSPDRYAPGGLLLGANQPYSQAHVRTDRATIIANYLQAGFLNASFRETAAAVSSDQPHRINVVYHIQEGPKVTTGRVITLGRVRTRQRLIDLDTASIKPGKPLTETELLTAGSRMFDRTGVFDWAEVDPRREITDQTSEDVLAKVHEARRNDFTYGLGFEIINRGGSIPSGTVALPNLPPIGLPANFAPSEVTFYGPRGSVQYTRNNLRGRGESLSLTAFAGRLDQRGAIYYIDPSILWSSWRATASFSAEHNEENPIFSAQQELASLQIQRPLDHLGRNTLFLRYTYSKTDLTRILIPDLVPPEDQNIHLSTFAANITRDTRDNGLDAHRGVLDSLELSINSARVGSSVSFAKLTAQAAIFKQRFHNIVWANSIRIGLAQPFASSFVPLSEQFFTGGGNTLRGFPLDGAGPQRQVLITGSGCEPTCSIQVPDGGNELLLLNSEARIPLPIKKGLGLVVFYDGGNVFPSVGFHQFTSLYSNNVGLGLRYATPVGPIRLDFGRNLNPVAGVNATQYFITIGQAF